MAIMGLVIVGLLVARIRAQQDHQAARQLLAATALCASKLDELKLGLLEEGSREIAGSGGFTYQVVKHPWQEGDELRLRRFDIAVRPPGPSLSDIDVNVTIWLPPQPSPEIAE